MPENSSGNNTVRVGVISDTHGRLIPEAARALEGVDVIIHAGDIGSPDVLAELELIAPVFAVKGNMDGGSWTRDLPSADVVAFGETLMYVLHDLHRLDLDPEAAGFKAVISGHTHQAAATRKEGVLYINPGSASQPRYGSSVSVALLRVNGENVDFRFVNLE